MEKKGKEASLQSYFHSKDIYLLAISKKGARSRHSQAPSPFPIGPMHLGILQMSVHGSQGVRSQKIRCWSLDACRLAIWATSLSLLGGKKKGGRTRQEDATNTSICSKLIGPSWATSRHEIKTNTASRCALSGPALSAFPRPPSPGPLIFKGPHYGSFWRITSQFSFKKNKVFSPPITGDAVRSW